MSKNLKMVFLLAFANALAFAATPMMMLIGSLLGVELAPSPNLATLPIALMVIGLALGVVPASRCMQSLGRRNALWLFMVIAIVACLLASKSLELSSFTLFCLAAALLGVANAALQQMRFAAIELVAPEDAPTAASIVMCGGIGAAIIGPELALAGKDLFAVAYQASFLMVACSIAIAALLLKFYTPATQKEILVGHTSKSAAQFFSNPNFLLAVASGMVAFMVMTFLMTGTPISMHHHFGHSLLDTKWVIQSHIAAMFLPSLITPWLFKLLGMRGMMVAGLCCYCSTVVIGFFDTSVNGFWMQLVMLGIGWNFLFVSGTALLPSTYEEGDQFKAQAVNDGVVFSIQAIASLTAGWAIAVASWQMVLMVCLVPVVLMVALLIKTASAEVLQKTPD